MKLCQPDGEAAGKRVARLYNPSPGLASAIHPNAVLTILIAVPQAARLPAEAPSGMKAAKDVAETIDRGANEGFGGGQRG